MHWYFTIHYQESRTIEQTIIMIILQGEARQVLCRPERGSGAVVREQHQPGREGLQGQVHRGQPGHHVRLRSGQFIQNYPGGSYQSCQILPAPPPFGDTIRVAKFILINVISNQIRNPSSESHQLSLSRWLTEDSLRAWNLLGLCTVVWRDNSGRDCALYENQCEYLQVGSEHL